MAKIYETRGNFKLRRMKQHQHLSLKKKINDEAMPVYLMMIDHKLNQECFMCFS